VRGARKVQQTRITGRYCHSSSLSENDELPITPEEAQGPHVILMKLRANRSPSVEDSTTAAMGLDRDTRGTPLVMIAIWRRGHSFEIAVETATSGLERITSFVRERNCRRRGRIGGRMQRECRSDKLFCNQGIMESTHCIARKRRLRIGWAEEQKKIESEMLNPIPTEASALCVSSNLLARAVLERVDQIQPKAFRSSRFSCQSSRR
jgi:hypothetical protein